MVRNMILFLVCLVCLNACATARSIPTIPAVHGTATFGTSDDESLLMAAASVAETYWNAQKTSDPVSFRSVTPQQSMKVVFDWSFVNKSNILVEEATISNIKSHLQQFMFHHDQYRLKKSHAEITTASAYAKSIESRYPMLGNLLQKGYWDAVIPRNIYDFGNYKLMKCNYVADVKLQSRAGRMLQKRTTLILYRMLADKRDSGWKVLFTIH
ncbi:MAG: hypothetical protein JRI72_07950 [Deltaproteobacteria bacterium]|nr:hypothetical protein [Deltaproteobacteria bacterium]